MSWLSNFVRPRIQALVTRRNVPENTAYRMIQRMAMDRKRKMADVAQDVIAMAGMLSDTE